MEKLETSALKDVVTEAVTHAFKDFDFRRHIDVALAPIINEVVKELTTDPEFQQLIASRVKTQMIEAINRVQFDVQKQGLW